MLRAPSWEGLGAPVVVTEEDEDEKEDAGLDSGLLQPSRITRTDTR